jgi:hypothetical protein
MRILEGSEFCFSLLSFSKLLTFFFFFIALSFKSMRLSIGSVVVVLVAEKRSCLGVQVFCGKYYSTKEDGDFLQNRRLDLAQPQNTDLPLLSEQQPRTERPDFK